MVESAPLPRGIASHGSSSVLSSPSAPCDANAAIVEDFGYVSDDIDEAGIAEVQQAARDAGFAVTDYRSSEAPPTANETRTIYQELVRTGSQSMWVTRRCVHQNAEFPRPGGNCSPGRGGLPCEWEPCSDKATRTIDRSTGEEVVLAVIRDAVSSGQGLTITRNGKPSMQIAARRPASGYDDEQRVYYAKTKYEVGDVVAPSIVRVFGGGAHGIRICFLHWSL